MLIYKLTFANGKIYIGQTIRAMETRYQQHAALARRGVPLAVYAAWRKYGAPVREVVGSYTDQADLDAAEIAEIARLNCRVPNGYNLAMGGGVGVMHESTKAKIGAVHRGRKQTEEHKAATAAASKANWQDEEYRAKVAAGIEASLTPERRAAMSAQASKNWEKRRAEGWQMPEHQRAALKGRVFSDEARAKMSASAKKRVRPPVSDETKAKMADAARAAHAREGNGRGEAIRAAHAARSPEERSEAAKRAWATKRAKD